MLKVKSKSQLKKNIEFDLKLFKSPFCFNESKKYKIYQYPKLNNSKFWKKLDIKKKKVLVLSGPARNGNHLLLSLLDGHPEIARHPGEDDFLRTFFSNVNLDQKKTIKKILKKDLNFIKRLSGQPSFVNNDNIGFNKWKELNLLKKEKKKLEIWSGNQPENVGHVQDFQSLIPDINYEKFEKNLNNISNYKIDNFFDFFYFYLGASRKLTSNFKEKKNLKYPYRITGSGLRRELFFLLERQKNIKVICPIRKFESFYYSYAKTRHNLNKKFHQKALDDMWEHWRHKVIDYLILKQKYPNNIAIIKYEEMVNNTEICMKKVCKFLSIKFSTKMLKPTVLDIPSLGNSSFKKNEKSRGTIYKKKIIFPKTIKLPIEYNKILDIINKFSL